MKNALILLMAILLTVPIYSQEKPGVSTDKNVLKVNTLSLIFATGSIFYERKISDVTSAQLGLGYMNLKTGETRFTGLLLTPELRIYPKKNAIDGFYVAPFLRYAKFSAEVISTSDKGSVICRGGGILLGRQWINDSGFTMDLFFGGNYSDVKVEATSGTDSFDTDLLSGFLPRIGFSLGFSF